MCSNNNNDAEFRCGSLCSIPEECDLDSFATAEPRADHLRVPFPSSSAVRRRVGPRCDALLEEQRVFHRSPVSLDNGYKPVVLVDLRAASASSDESTSPADVDGIMLEDRDTPRGPRGSLSYAMTILCRVAAVLGAMIGVGAAMFVVAVVTLLLRDRLWR